MSQTKYNDNEVFPGLESFLQDFLKDRENEVKTLQKDLVDKSYNNIKKISHQWKGFCAPYGFNTLAVFAREIESIIESQDDSLLEIKLTEIESYLRYKRESLPI